MKAKNVTRRLLAAGLAGVMVMGTLTGCGDAKETNGGNESKTESKVETSKDNKEENKGETVTINWYRETYHTNVDEKVVEDAINEYIEPILGVKVNVMNAAENTELGLALAAGDDIDIYWCDYGTGPSYIRNKSALDITDLLPQYPELHDSIPDKIWDAAKVDARNYYIPVYKEAAQGGGVTVPKALVEKYNWDLSKVKTWSDLTPLMADVYADGCEMTFTTNRTSDFFLLDSIAYLDQNVGIRRDDPTKVVDVTKQPEYRAYLDLMREWNLAGYINQSEAAGNTVDNVVEKVQSGDNAFNTWYLMPDSDANATIRYKTEMVTIPLTKNWIDSNSPFGSCYMINAKSDKVDACMRFLGMLSTDEKLANLCVFGIEGRHWNRNADGRVELVPDSGYSYSGLWCVCNVMAASLQVGEAEDKKEQYAAFNDSAIISCAAGFRFDPTPVEAELAALKAATDEYEKLMQLGFYDVDEYLAKYQSAREKAGLDKVIAEAQKQYDAWLALQ